MNFRIFTERDFSLRAVHTLGKLEFVAKGARIAHYRHNLTFIQIRYIKMLRAFKIQELISVAKRSSTLENSSWIFAWFYWPEKIINWYKNIYNVGVTMTQANFTKPSFKNKQYSSSNLPRVEQELWGRSWQ